MNTEILSEQKQFIERLKGLVPSGHSLPQLMSDVLDISTDGAYRRIRNQTSLSMDEFLKLARHFRIPLDSLEDTGKEQVVSFRFQPLGNDGNKFANYFGSLAQDLERIAAMNGQLTFTSEDVPLFHYFKHPYMSAFKLFYWNKSVLNVPEFEDKKFDPDLVPESLVKMGQKLYRLYNKVNSVEIWTEDTVLSAIKQIDFYHEARLFKNKEQSLRLLEELEMVFERIRKIAEQGYKSDPTLGIEEQPGSFAMYQCDIMVGNNLVHAKLGDIKMSYLIFNTFNSVSTNNPRFNEEVERWITTLVTKSTLISGTSEKQRNKFLNTIFKKVERLREKIQNDE